MFKKKNLSNKCSFWNFLFIKEPWIHNFIKNNKQQTAQLYLVLITITFFLKAQKE